MHTITSRTHTLLSSKFESAARDNEILLIRMRSPVLLVKREKVQEISIKSEYENTGEDYLFEITTGSLV